MGGQCEAKVCDPAWLDINQTTYPDGCEQAGHTVFVTSALYNSNLGGLSGADSKCASLASAAGRSGNWRAILSTSTVNARDRFPGAGPIADPQGRVVANGMSDLWDGTIQRRIELNESGVSRGTTLVWSGTATTGNRDSWTGYCSNWTTTGTSGVQTGRTDYTDYRWIALHIGAARTSCTANLALYCMSVP
jgi:hypothetical protein